MIDRGPGRFIVTRLADDLGLTRRQTLNALHGLSHHGLEDQLTRNGTGMWTYQPPAVLRTQDEYADPKYDDGREPARTNYPMGFTGTVKIIGRVGDRYLVQGVEGTNTQDLYATFEIIDGPIENLVED